MPDKVFISYKSEQRAIALRVRDVIRAHKRPTWFDQDDIPEGGFFRDAIDQGLKNSAVVVGILTEAALNSREVKFEWNYAVSGKARMILLRYEAVELPYWLQGVQYIDCLSNESAGLAQLQSALDESPAPTSAPPVPLTAPTRTQRFPAYVSPVLPDESLQRQRRRRRIALWVLLLFAALTLGSLFVFDDRTVTLFLGAIAFIPAIVALMPNNASAKAAINKSADPIRTTILENVHQAWIEGVLRPNLPAGALDLGLGLRSEAVLRHVDYDDYELPNSSGDIARIFTDMHGELLILGAPGAGKTILLLQLTEQLLGRAQHAPQAPLPLVFNLASWREGKPFADWLVEELRRNYGVPEKTAQKLVAAGKLALLLDGLDELAVSADMMPGADAAALDAEAIKLRGACIEAINSYCKAHADLLEIAVCSRIKDYEALSAKLDLNAAILFSPLSVAQIAHYLAGEAHVGTHELLAQEESARQIAESPLLLSIMKQTYQDEPYAGSPHRQLKLVGDDPGARQQHLFNAYLRQSLSAASDAPYTPQQTRHYLNWLAYQMVQHKQTVFYIESLQPDWARDEQRYRQLVILIVALSFIPILVETIVISILLIFLWSIGTIVWEMTERPEEERLKIDVKFTEINISDRLRFSFSSTWLFAWLGAGISFGVLELFSGKTNSGLSLMVFGGVIGVVFGVIGGVGIESRPQFRREAGAGFRGTLQNTLIGALFGVLLMSALLLDGGMIIGRANIAAGLIGGLFNGGIALVQHIALRFVLMQEGVIPRRPHWRYDRFLDHCAELGLLRKVGGGYIFRHRLLLEHLAQEYTPRP